MKRKTHKRSERPCSKLSFPTKGSARRTLEIAAQQRGENPRPLRIYPCPQCGQFHYSSQPDPKRRDDDA